MRYRLGILTPVLFLGALLLAGCGLTRNQGPAVDVNCDEFMQVQNVERALNVSSGGSFAVMLCSNPTTGFEWEPAEIGDPAVLRETGHRYVSPDDIKPPRPGAAGQEIWTFEALQAGQSTISIAYSRPWEGGEKATWTFALTVVVD